MEINEAPRAFRVQIGIFGRTNSGKSSLINAIAGQEVSIVSSISGTTTDPVSKGMEILPIGPVMLIDTPGLDDETELKAIRIKRTEQTLKKVDIAIVVIDGSNKDVLLETKLIERLKKENKKTLIVANKCDKKDFSIPAIIEGQVIKVSAKTLENIDLIKMGLINLAQIDKKENKIVVDLVGEGDLIVLVIPIDTAAPKGRLILPQQQVIREILDCGGFVTITKEKDLSKVLKSTTIKPKLVITDSQVFENVSKIVPKEIPLTSFSILFARCKGILKEATINVQAIRKIKDGDKILICEGCTHHRQCDDIGTVKIPALIRKVIGVSPKFEFTSGLSFTDYIGDYKMIIHCGGCMLLNKEVEQRLSIASQKNVPFTNYGILIAYLTGILKRSVFIFKDIYNIIEK